MLKSLLKYFGAAQRSRSTHSPSGHRMLPIQDQREIMNAAQKRRERRMARPQGYYQG